MKDKPESEYKDDPDDFAQSSDLAQRGKTGEYAGGGVDDSSANFTPAKGEQNWQKAKPGEATKDDDEEVTSRSADPGQSSDGGFRDEGTSKQNAGDK